MKKTKIILCKHCKGKGHFVIPGECTNGHTGEYAESTKRTCWDCNGHGRIKRIVTIEYEVLDDE